MSEESVCTQRVPLRKMKGEDQGIYSQTHYYGFAKNQKYQIIGQGGFLEKSTQDLQNAKCLFAKKEDGKHLCRQREREQEAKVKI